MRCERACRGDARQWLRGQGQIELLDDEFVVGVGLGVAGQDQGAAVGGWEVNVEHLDGGKLVEDGPGGEARCRRPEPSLEGDVQAIGDEGDKDVGFDAMLKLVIDRAQLQIALEVFEGGLKPPPLERLKSHLC